MFFRSRRVDCYKYNVARFLSGAIFLVGCLLLLNQFSDSAKFLKKEAKSVTAIRLHEASTVQLSPWAADLKQVDTFRVAGANLLSGDSDRENGPSGQSNTPSSELFEERKIKTILKSIRKKVALVNRQVVNLHEFKYLHNVPSACVGRKVELLVGVPTRADSFEARQAIRESWGQFGADPANNAVVLFFLGWKDDPAVQEKINTEASKYGDIVQEDFVDSYRNLSLKTVALMRWVTTYCSESTFLLKADDDMYINMPRLVMKLRQQLQRGPMFILGAVHYNTEPFRDQNNKWFVTYEEYAQNLFPNYMSGTAYAMTTSAAMRLYVESLYVRNLFLEDVYMTGLVADRAAIPRVKEADFNWGKLDPDGCSFKDKISGHKNSPEDIRKIHTELFDPNLRCS